MCRTTLALALAAATLALVTGCKRDDGQSAGITTIRSGTPDGMRVTSAPPDPATGGMEQAAGRMAAALCSHERSCVTAGREDLSPEAVLLAEAVCVAELKPVARQNVEAWDCSPAVARAGFEECVAAIKADVRCREILLNESSDISQCRPSEVCRKGEGITRR